MRWSDEGIYLNGRAFGETSVIANIFTRDHGRTLGLVKGGRSRKIRPLLQTGNVLTVDWRARLDDQLGVYTAELAQATAATVLDDELKLCGLMALASLLQIMPERDPHPRLYEGALIYLANAATDRAAEHLVRFELRLLEELGFGLDLSECAATGVTENLIYVSPKSGRSVSREAGEPYQDKLLRLPEYLSSRQRAASRDEIQQGLELTSHFLTANIFADRNASIPEARRRFAAMYAAHDRDLAPHDRD